MCQDWMHENGLFVWMCSEMGKHLKIMFQEQDWRLGAKPGVVIGKWLKTTARSSGRACPAQAFVFHEQLMAPQILAWQWEGFWPTRSYLGDHQLLRALEVLSHKEKLKTPWLLNLNREDFRDAIMHIPNYLKNYRKEKELNCYSLLF